MDDMERQLQRTAEDDREDQSKNTKMIVNASSWTMRLDGMEWLLRHTEHRWKKLLGCRPSSILEPEGLKGERILDCLPTVMQVASRHGQEIIDMEREEHAAERARLEDEAEKARVAAEQENKRVYGQQDEERHQREIDESDLGERQRAEQEESDDGIRQQLGDIMNFMNEQQALADEKRQLIEEQYDKKRGKQAQRDEDMLNSVAMMNEM
ncbi:hypothetical protein PQX77_021045 [Marasmius sp. AFHP31]|nr:hypothetical protein PQX77_021045 [Marasmius sp. AFHP31]